MKTSKPAPHINDLIRLSRESAGLRGGECGMPGLESLRCDRCGVRAGSTIMSKFNEDILCRACKEDECECPNYEKADQAECDAVRSGVRNFPGIGLAPEDRAFLAERLKLRRCAKNESAGGLDRRSRQKGETRRHASQQSRKS